MLVFSLDIYPLHIQFTAQKFELVGCPKFLLRSSVADAKDLADFDVDLLFVKQMRL